MVPMSVVVELWDRYFFDESGFEIHPFVCLGLWKRSRLCAVADRPDLASPAILRVFKDELEELEEDSLNRFLMNLPLFDVNEVSTRNTHIWCRFSRCCRSLSVQPTSARTRSASDGVCEC